MLLWKLLYLCIYAWNNKSILCWWLYKNVDMTYYFCCSCFWATIKRTGVLRVMDKPNSYCYFLHNWFPVFYFSSTIWITKKMNLFFSDKLWLWMFRSHFEHKRSNKSRRGYLVLFISFAPVVYGQSDLAAMLVADWHMVLCARKLWVHDVNVTNKITDASCVEDML